MTRWLRWVLLAASATTFLAVWILAGINKGRASQDEFSILLLWGLLVLASGLLVAAKMASRR